MTQWIKVEDRLPTLEDGTHLLAIYVKQFFGGNVQAITIAAYEDGGGVEDPVWFMWDNSKHLEWSGGLNVTHWMRLPEFP